MNIDSKTMSETKKTLLKFGDKYLTESGQLKTFNLVNDLDNFNKDLMTALFQNETVYRNYVEKINGTDVFKINKFTEMFQYKKFWEDSYTKYSNSIGLTSDNKFISGSSDVVLGFPYKDCVLEAGMTKEDSEDNNELFLNEVIAKPEIDELLEPKIFKNVNKYNINGEKEISQFSDDENLVIKGNNLISLHSLVKRYSGKIKMVYLDPPYNTGEDFPYNDKFNHSSWLTFMKNRFEIIKQLLSSSDGIICVQCDDNEQAYLKVLMDEIFGPQKFLTTIVVQMSQPTGFKMSHAETRLPKIKEYVLVYKMNPNSNINIVKKQKEEWDSEYKSIITNITKSDIDYINRVCENTERTESEVNKVDSILSKASYESISKYFKNNNIKDELNFKKDNAWRIFQTVSMPSVSNKKLAVNKRNSLNNQLFFSIVTPGKKMYIIKGDFDEKVNKPRTKTIFASNYLDVNVCDLWTDIKTTGLDNEGVVKLSNGKKPENLIKRLIKMFSNENDIVLDAFSGTGTTGAVSLKMNRRFICLEQLEEHIDLQMKRLKQVIDGEQSGISKDMDWHGGSSFIYAELMEKNYEYIRKIQKAKSIQDLDNIYRSIRNIDDLNITVDLNKFDQTNKKLNFDDFKKSLFETLDKNQLYYNYLNIEDDNVKSKLSESDYQFNNSFYK